MLCRAFTKMLQLLGTPSPLSTAITKRVPFRKIMDQPIRSLQHRMKYTNVKGQLAGGGGILWRPPASCSATKMLK